MVDGIIATLSSKGNFTKLYYEGKVIYTPKHTPPSNYFHSWASIGRVSTIVGKRIFYLTLDNKVVSLSMDKAAIDRGALIEVVHHQMDRLAHFWADNKNVVCLDDLGHVDIVGYVGSHRKVISSVDLSSHLFTEERCFDEARTETTTITGCSKYLVVILYADSDKSHTVCLLDRRGRYQSKATNSANAYYIGGPNTIHSVEFSAFKKRLYLVAQHLFSFVSLYVINPLRKAKIFYIGTIVTKINDVKWHLIPVSSNPDQFISAAIEPFHMLQIKLN